MTSRSRGTARVRIGVLAVSLALIAGAASAPGASPAGPLSATVTPAELLLGSQASVTGALHEGGQGVGAALVELQASPYPFGAFTTVSRAVTAADGSFSFSAVSFERNTRLRVVLAGAPFTTSAELSVTVDPIVALASHSLAPGQVRLGVRVRHTVHAGSPASSAWWFLAAAGSHRFHLAAVTPAREAATGITSASAIVAPPSRLFDYFVCMSPSWENAMGMASTHRRCPRADFSSSSPLLGEYVGETRGSPLAAFPSAGAIAAAERFLAARAGRTSFAVLDSSGHLSGVHLREHFQTASVIKLMFLTAYLQRLNALHRGLRAADNALLYPMIHISDNEAASAVLAVVGESAVERVAREAGMSDYAPGVGWWAYSQTSAADQVRLIIALERLIPTQFYAYARGLMAGIEPEQSWGFPPVARPRWQVFFKTGALPSEGLFNEVALLERPGLKIAVAVLTDGDPSMAYGEGTIEGLASILLEHTP
jgi:hypothetical protein